jgi:alkylhydroperoxidase family enzyme
MGHSEMLLAVAGLTTSEIETRAAQLADGEWSEFSAAEQAAFAFARKLTAEPWNVNDADVDALRAHYGERRALDLVWHVAWGNYMTRVADAFQLPLERENIFARPPASAPAAAPAK